MRNIINFPETKEMKSWKLNNKIDNEIKEIHAKVDSEIYSNFGSLEKYGESIINELIYKRIKIRE